MSSWLGFLECGHASAWSGKDPRMFNTYETRMSTESGVVRWAAVTDEEMRAGLAESAKHSRIVTGETICSVIDLGWGEIEATEKITDKLVHDCGGIITP